MPVTQSCQVAVNAPSGQNFSQLYPSLIKWLKIHWMAAILSTECSTGNFLSALEHGTPLGHVWAEVFYFVLAELAWRLDLDFIALSERVKFKEEIVTQEEHKVIYNFSIFYQRRLPFSVVGIETLVTGYLNACVEDEEFDIHGRIEEMARYRVAKTGPRRGEKRPRRGPNNGG